MSLSLALKLIEPQDGWNRDANPMTKDEYGVWELVIPAKDGRPAIPHNSKVKVASCRRYFKINLLFG